ncbi:ABC transporter ATP-binding protein [Pontibacter sp. BAB1700]|uniref:ABC transporter ATP-binding protein n=1 Tax=Pontibacter sp. BAB1700 TaxID=1144253 RepID=UPI00192BDD86|nr:ABC transporter ATP-binding protein [Pontibacter sp. BAB1700]
MQVNYQVKIRHLFVSRVRNHLVDNLQQLTYEGFLKLDAGRIQNSLLGEVQRLFQSMSAFLNSTQTSVMLITYVFLAFLANYQFAFFVAIGAGLSNLIYRSIYRETKSASVDLSKKGDNFNGYLVQAVQNFKYLKATNNFSVYSKKLKAVIAETEDLNKRIGFLNSITLSVKEPIIIIIVAVVILLQIKIMGSNLSSILLSLLLFYRALSFLMVVQNWWQTFIQNVGGIHATSSISNEMAQWKEQTSHQDFDSKRTDIKVKGAFFSYGRKRVLDDVNIVIPNKSTVAFIGESGSGKTTLANLLCGLIKLDEGGVFINDINLEEYNIASYRSRIGYISQEPVIFNDNIYNNITFWAPRNIENLNKFWRAVELASLKEFINDSPEQELTEVGDNGMLISGGQKQRISIARELYKDAELLILDEATSALDSETESLIKENIDKLHGQYTIVIIAHRLATIKEADLIYLLDKGKVIGSGTFADMLTTSSKFRKMVSLQEVSV